MSYFFLHITIKSQHRNTLLNSSTPIFQEGQPNYSLCNKAEQLFLAGDVVIVRGNGEVMWGNPDKKELGLNHCSASSPLEIKVGWLYGYSQTSRRRDILQLSSLQLLSLRQDGKLLVCFVHVKDLIQCLNQLIEIIFQEDC